MIAHLRGTVAKMDPGQVSVDVAGVGYLVSVPLTVWDELREGEPTVVWTSTYVREDRFELYGFTDPKTRSFFEELISRQGIGPKLGLELCDVPRAFFAQALAQEDAKLLTTVKGIGRKTAEKLLIELKAMAEKEPTYFIASPAQGDLGGQYDRDAVAALTQLGYGMQDVLQALEGLPKSLRTTEERVTAALRSL